MRMLITLPKGAKDITVTISDGANPISGATVTVAGNEQTSGADGKASFEDVTEGSQTITVTKSGYQDYSSTITVGSTTKFTVTMTAVGTLTIIVTDSEDTPSPIEGAVVTLGDDSETTGADGKVEFSNLTYTDKEVTIEATGYTTATETLQFRANHKSFTVALTTE